MSIQDAIAQVSHSYYLVAIGALVTADFITGILSAVKRGVFSWKKIGDIIPKNILMSLITLAVQAVSNASLSQPLNGIVDAGTFSVLVTSVGHSTIENLDEVTGMNVLPYVNGLTQWLVGWLKKKPA